MFPAPLRASLLCAALLLGPASAAAQGQRIGRDLVLGRVLAAATDVEGRVCIADDLESRVHCLQPNGALEWSVGRKGEGPGEFKMVYRLALAESGDLYAYDLVGRSISRFDRRGRFLARMPLPLGAVQVASMLAVGADRLVVTARVINAGTAEDDAIHVLRIGGDGTLHRERSFGPLPAIEDPRARQFFGAGIATLTSRGTILYSRRYPYEVLEYSLDGRLLSRMIGPAATVARPEDLVLIRESAKAVSFTPNPNPSGDRIGVALELPRNRLAVLRTDPGGHRVFDVLERASGRWHQSPPLGAAAITAVLFDPIRRISVFAEECDDEPCLVRYPLGVP